MLCELSSTSVLLTTLQLLSQTCVLKLTVSMLQQTAFYIQNIRAHPRSDDAEG